MTPDDGLVLEGGGDDLRSMPTLLYHTLEEKAPIPVLGGEQCDSNLRTCLFS